MSKAFTKDDEQPVVVAPARTNLARFTAPGLAHLKAKIAAGGEVASWKALESRAQVAGPEASSTVAPGRAAFGSSVTVKESTGATRVYLLVGPEEVPVWPRGPGLPTAVAIDSPLGQALFERQAGDEVEVELPRGTIELEVVSVG